MTRYEGVPNKRRRVYADESGRLLPLEKTTSALDQFLVSSSGTLLGDGHLTLTGTEFAPDSVVWACYNGTSAGTAPLATAPGDGVVTFHGDASAKFYYVVVNKK